MIWVKWTVSIVAMILGIVVQTKVPSGFKTYTNSSYGYSIEYPARWAHGQLPTDRDGEVFYTPANSRFYENSYDHRYKRAAELEVIGMPNAVLGNGVSNLNQLYIKIKQTIPEMKKAPGTISVRYGETQQWIWVLISKNLGHNARLIRKQYFNRYVVDQFTFVYPISRSKAYKALLSQIESSFHPPATETE